MNQNVGLTSPGRITGAAPPLPNRTVWEAALSTWYSSRIFALTLLTIAVIVGAYYRFHQLDRWDMNGDEAVAWTAVVQPSVPEVVRTFWRSENGGKLPLFDLALHGWVRIFGDSLFAMRAMSAALGTLAIVLLFFVVREVCRSLGSEAAPETGAMAGAFAALIYALNLTMVQSDRTAREFPLLTVAELVQIFFFVRAQRRGAWRDAWKDYLGVAAFTAIMLPINYTASFLLCAEALWLGCLLLARLAGSERAGQVAIYAPGIAVAAGIGLLAPLLPGVIASSHDAVRSGAVGWIRVQPASWPYTVFRDVAVKRRLLELLEVLMVFGIFWQWRSARLAWGFLAAWMLGPILAIVLITYTINSMEFPRYALIAFVGMFALAGLGAGSVRSTVVRVLIAA